LVFSAPDYKCAFGSYPPDAGRGLPTYVVDLDLPPAERWTKLASDKKVEIKNLIQNLKNISDAFFHGKLIYLIDRFLPKLTETLPYPFADELKGISNATGIPLGEITMYNIFYEIFTVCTSIIAQDKQGKLYHGRNLDFGLFLGWDVQNKTWSATEILRTMVANIEFQRNGKTLFRSVQFAGYVGILTGMKPKILTLTIDERFQLKGGYIGLIEWILGYRTGSWMGFLARKVMENSTSYSEAKQLLTDTRLLAPVYFILGGNQSGEGCVITRDLNDADVWELGSDPSKWFLVQTNYDHWNNPPFFDDRRTPTIRCMNKLTQDNMTLPGLFDVLSSKPALNKLTTYTAIMQVNEDKWESYIQDCQEPCMPW